MMIGWALCQARNRGGRVLSELRIRNLAIIDRLVARGAEAVILGCTEIPLLVTSADTPVPLIDTTAVHAEAALEAALSS